MRAFPRAACGLGLAALIATLVVLAQPAPERAQANVECEVASGGLGIVSEGVGAITGGAIGGGNPVGDICNEVTDGVVGAVTNPIGSAVEGLGNSIFQQITEWADEGAAWLIEKVVAVVEETTTPQLTSAAFLHSYAQMALIGSLLAAAMLLLAVLEGIAQGNMAMLGRVVLVNLPLAFIATSVAYVIVQMLLVGTDGLCHAIGQASQHSGEHFFSRAVKGLSHAGGKVGEAANSVGPGLPAGGKVAGEAATPLFVGFLAAIVGGLAAFFVWLELLMRDAAVYVVALFMPLALASSIWPRWSGAMRRTGELIAVVIGSKFVIVAIIALAAGLVSEKAGGVEHILAAAALMALACFSPFALFRLVPFAEGAMAAAYGRRHAASSAIGAGRSVSSTAQSVHRAARMSWSRGERGRAGRSSGAGVPGKPGGAGAAQPGAPSPAAAGAAAGGVAVAGSLPIAAARGAQGGAEKLAGTGQAEAIQQSGAADGASAPKSTPPQAGNGGQIPMADGPEQTARPKIEPTRGSGAARSQSGEGPPRPRPEPPSSRGKGR